MNGRSICIVMVKIRARILMGEGGRGVLSYQRQHASKKVGERQSHSAGTLANLHKIQRNILLVALSNHIAYMHVY